MSIKPLPGDVVAQIKSSVAITSLNSVICGLVKNALDAEATKINLAVDYSRGNCSIEDNGVGIPPLEFKDTGGLGQLHCMSTMMPEISGGVWWFFLLFQAQAANGATKIRRSIRPGQMSTGNTAHSWLQLPPCRYLPSHHTTGTTTLITR